MTAFRFHVFCVRCFHVHTLLLLLVVVQILYALSHRQWQGIHVH